MVRRPQRSNEGLQGQVFRGGISNETKLDNKNSKVLGEVWK